MGQLVDIEYGTTLKAVTCGSCHIPFAIPEGLWEAGHREGRTFHCPNGHYIGWSDTEFKRLQRERDQLRDAKERLIRQRDAARDEAEHQRRVAIGTKGALVKTQKRIAKGVCPCCNRQFTNVERHMANQHPGYEAS